MESHNKSQKFMYHYSCQTHKPFAIMLLCGSNFPVDTSNTKEGIIINCKYVKNYKQNCSSWRGETLGISPKLFVQNPKWFMLSDKLEEQINSSAKWAMLLH